MTHILKSVVAVKADSVVAHEAQEPETVLNANHDDVLGFSKVGSINSVGGGVSGDEGTTMDLRGAGAVSEARR